MLRKAEVAGWLRRSDVLLVLCLLSSVFVAAQKAMIQLMQQEEQRRLEGGED